MRPVIVEIAIEDRRSKQHHHCGRPPKTRDLGLQPQIYLIGSVSGHSDVRTLDAGDLLGLRWNRVPPREPLAHHHGFPSEDHRRTIEIDWLDHAADAIAVAIECILRDSHRLASLISDS